ncbi:MAG: tetratricopeptide repeat protein [Myxococcales bacterium]|nr:tetratricopeptide repeat protein [Myxococcales bacterium]
MWRRNTAKPRVCAEFDPIAWGSFPDDDRDDFDDNATCRASDLAGAGDLDGARELLMNVLLRDLRCIDAHALLGFVEFHRSPRTALLHYEIGVGIGELSLPPGFDGVLQWGRIYNRPYLRALHGQGLCLWRLGHFERALQVFDRILAFNPNDNQGVRFIREDVIQRRPWESTRERRSVSAS